MNAFPSLTILTAIRRVGHHTANNNPQYHSNYTENNTSHKEKNEPKF